jgi:hypothetical protein
MNSLRSALTAALASQIIPTIRGIGVTSKNELAPTTEAQPRERRLPEGLYVQTRTAATSALTFLTFS